jgi:hypothetical protein
LLGRITKKDLVSRKDSQRLMQILQVSRSSRKPNKPQSLVANSYTLPA